MEPGESRPESQPENHFSREELKQAAEGFEQLARRLNELWMKEEPLTASEQKEVELILNNAMVIQEMIEGKKPEELEKKIG